MGRVEALFTAPADGEPMRAHETVDVVDGGIRGDRYLLGTGHYAPFDVCEVTFVASEGLEFVRDEYDIDLSDGRHRRNVVTRDVDLRALLETTFRVGDAVFRGTRPRPPCAHVERVAGEEGVARALKEGRGGICADVIDPGSVTVGDDVAVVEAAPRDVGRDIAARLRETRE
ncbi:MOSC domain-containing protein [Salinigranum halophilum]|jgi:MOSC domain-containing protein YiiM|uniref:MOSC domain-containing protein n=1 Tax=Salinigranum halophilum TaxID=2565931 RepID=UPI0010A7BD75|nr:MOSC domain-containing protein [Salinigranum halophilum]